MKRTTIIETITALFIILFLYTGISKLMEYDVFREQMAALPVQAPIAALVGRWLSIMEFLLVVMLIVPRWRLKGLHAASALMMDFTIYIIALMTFNDQLPCSCGGVLAELSWGSILFSTVPLS